MNPQADALELYHHLLAAWDRRDAAGMADLFTDDGNIVGFDGSLLDSPKEIKDTLSEIFGQHPTPPFISKVRHVRMITDDTALVSSVVGMVPPGQIEIDPKLNAIQSMLAVKSNGKWKVALFQNTPAALHGRPELVEKMTSELSRAAGGNPSQSLVDG